MENDRGLSTEPCGVPVYEVIDFDMVLLNPVLQVLPVKELATKLITCKSRCVSSGSRCLTSIALDAVEKSKNRQRA